MIRTERRERRGLTVVEAALVLIVFGGMLFGTFQILFSVQPWQSSTFWSSLHDRSVTIPYLTDARLQFVERTSRKRSLQLVGIDQTGREVTAEISVRAAYELIEKETNDDR